MNHVGLWTACESLVTRGAGSQWPCLLRGVIVDGSPSWGQVSQPRCFHAMQDPGGLWRSPLALAILVETWKLRLDVAAERLSPSSDFWLNLSHWTMWINLLRISRRYHKDMLLWLKREGESHTWMDGGLKGLKQNCLESFPRPDHLSRKAPSSFFLKYPLGLNEGFWWLEGHLPRAHYFCPVVSLKFTSVHPPA